LGTAKFGPRTAAPSSARPDNPVLDLLILACPIILESGAPLRILRACEDFGMAVEVLSIEGLAWEAENFPKAKRLYCLTPEEWTQGNLLSLENLCPGLINRDYFRLGLDKKSVKETMKSLGIPVPKSLDFALGAGFMASLSKNGLVVKSKLHGRKTYVVSGPDDWSACTRKLDASSHYVEEYIHGSMCFKVYYAGRKAVASRTIEYSDFLQCASAAERVKERFRVSVFSMDLVKEQETGGLYFIDLNAAPGFAGMASLADFLAAGIAESS
jgi:hypothetical protein